ncbi:MAG: hypothetical protein WCG10_01695 [Chlamydiota bacterium]
MTSIIPIQTLPPNSKAYIYQEPSLDSFKTIAKEAMKVDHQIYSKKRLSPIEFSLNAALPSIFDAISAPYKIIKTLTSLAKEKLKTVSVSLEESHWQLAADSLHFINGLITPLSYLSIIGIYTTHIAVLAPLLFITGFVLSSIELGINIQNFYRQYDFYNKTELSLLKKTEELSSVQNTKTLKKTINSLIKHLKTHLPREALRTTHQSLLQTLETLQQNPNQLQNLIPSIQKLTIEYLLDSLHDIYLVINEKSQNKILHKIQEYYRDQKYPTALHSAFSLIQHVFAEKKILLAKRIEPWLALDVTKKYTPIREKLRATDKSEQEDGIKQGRDLLLRISCNAEIKKKVCITNIALFAITLASYCLSPLSSIIPIFFFIATLSIYTANHMIIYGYLNSERPYDFHFINCLPKWCTAAASKIQSLFSPNVSSINATDLTHVIRKNRCYS